MNQPPKLLFWLIQGADFRRSIDWHRKQPTFGQVLKEAMEKEKSRAATYSPLTPTRTGS